MDQIIPNSTNKTKSYSDKIKENKIPIIITVSFFVIFFYVAFIENTADNRYDGILFLKHAEQILAGDGESVYFFNDPPFLGIIYALTNQVFGNPFISVKLIQLISGTGLIFFSFFILKNIFDFKTAIIGQIFFASLPIFHIAVIESLHELYPILLIFVSIYFLTKKQTNYFDFAMAGIFIGLAFSVRFVGLPIMFGVILFLLIRDKKIKKNLKYIGVFLIFFGIAISPLIFYTYSTHGTFLEGSSNALFLWEWQHRYPEWELEMTKLVLNNSSTLDGIFLDFDLFLKNYLHNFFFNNSDWFYNLGGITENIKHPNTNMSLIPLIPFLGFIPVFASLIYLSRSSLSKNNLIILFSLSGLCLILTITLGDIPTHFFSIFLIPLIALCILNIKNSQKNLLFILVLPLAYLLVLSMIQGYRAEHYLPIWLFIPGLTAYFFVQVFPKFLLKIKIIKSNSKIPKISLILIISILVANVAFSYQTIEMYIYNDEFTTISDEINELFDKDITNEKQHTEIKKIGSILSNEDDIENKYVMASSLVYAIHADSKYMYTEFNEGLPEDSLSDFVTRENWSPIQLMFADSNNIPMDRLKRENVNPDYVVFDPDLLKGSIISPYSEKQYEKITFILSNPNHSKIPDNWEILYHNVEKNTVVYKINYEE